MRRVSGIDTREEQHGGDHEGREVEEAVLPDVGPAQCLHRAEDAEQRDVLLQAHEIVHQRRHHPAHGLGEHDRPHRLPR